MAAEAAGDEKVPKVETRNAMVRKAGSPAAAYSAGDAMSRAALASLKLTVRVLRLNLSAIAPAKGAKRMTGIASTTMTIAEWARSPVVP